MYTLIEIFDAKQYENIITPMSLSGIDKIIYIGAPEIMTREKVLYIGNFFAAKKMNVEYDFVFTERDNSRSVLNAMEKIISEHQNCIFDVTGGDDIFLTLAGVISQKYNIPLVRINAKSGKLTVVYGEREKFNVHPFRMNIDDIVILQGGMIEKRTPFKEPSKEDLKSLRVLMKINGESPESYSTFCNIISEYISGSEMRVNINKASYLKKVKQTHFPIDNILKRLIREKVFTNVKQTKSHLTGDIRSRLSLRCLLKAGNLLELYTACALFNASKFSDVPYRDITNSVVIDWSEKKEILETQNEIDVLSMYDNIPVFISCKNGEVRKEALYELDTVSRALGGIYSKKILVTSYISRNKSSRDHLIKRAQDMGIGICCNAHKCDIDSLSHRIINATKFSK